MKTVREWLKGKKTYIFAGCALVILTVQTITGEIPPDEMLGQVYKMLTDGAIITLRVAIANMAKNQ